MTRSCAVSLFATAIVLVQVGAVGVGLLVDQELSDRGDEDQRRRCSTTSHRSLRLWSRPVGYASRSWTNAPEREAVHDHAEREDPVVVRLGQRAEEPEVRDEDEEDAGAVLRAAPERDHAGGEEREPDGEREREERALVLDVVAREDERRADCRQRQAAERDQDECAGSHPSRSASAVPPSSALGMKPRAPLCSISSP